MKFVKFVPAAIHFALMLAWGIHTGFTNLPYKVEDNDIIGQVIGISFALSAVVFWIWMFAHFLIFTLPGITFIALKILSICLFIFFNWSAAVIYLFYLIAKFIMIIRRKQLKHHDAQPGVQADVHEKP